MERVHIPPDIFGKIASGDRCAFEELYRMTYTSVYAYLLSLTKNPEDAKDLMQEVYIRIYKSADLYRNQGTPMAWILKICKNLFLMKLRSDKTRPESQALELMEQDMGFSNMKDVESRILLEQLFSILTDEERGIVIMYVMMGLKHREIAKELDLPLGTVLSKYRRALKKLQNAAKEESGDF